MNQTPQRRLIHYATAGSVVALGAWSGYQYFHPYVAKVKPGNMDAIKDLFEKYATVQPNGSKRISVEGVRALMGSVSEEKVKVRVLGEV